MPRDTPRQRDTQAWLSKADVDLRAARLDLGADPPILEDASFHCQQAVEKALKALLTWHDRPFRRTHDLNELGRQVATLEPELEALLREAAVLSEFASAYRYPGDPPELTPPEVLASLSLATSVVEAIRERMPRALRWQEPGTTG